MNIMAKFYKVSFEQFKSDWVDKNPTSKTDWSDDELKEIYEGIQLPRRGTAGSAGYDFFIPCDINLNFNDSLVIPTGIRCRISGGGWFLDLNPRSGHGFKYGLRLANTRGIIDSDYYCADNEGHIMVKLVNDSSAINKEQKTVTIDNGTAFCQGIFTQYGVTEDDSTTEERTGGFGSTDK